VPVATVASLATVVALPRADVSGPATSWFMADLLSDAGGQGGGYQNSGSYGGEQGGE
jgi:hypothetical protein